MARVRWNKTRLPSYVDSMYSNTEDWEYIRKAPELVTFFDGLGSSWVEVLNRELNNAQRARKQPVADGYAYAIRVNDDRIRMRIWCTTARAMAHEAKHQSILRMMGTSGFDVNRKGKAQWDWGGKSGTKGKRKPSGGSGRRKPPPKSGSERVNKLVNDAKLRRRLMALDALAERGATEGERKSAAEKARRIRSKLGE